MKFPSFIKKRGAPSFRFEELPSADLWDPTTHIDTANEIFGPFSNSLTYYDNVLSQIQSINELSITPLYRLFDETNEQVRRIALRHDVDFDPYAALRCARLLARYGTCGSFYLLHTNPYYGRVVNETFVRNPYLAEFVDGLMVAGAEIGLHNDALNIFQNWNRDGNGALTQEIAWLRGRGVTIHGTVAHNSGPVYGAENYEIFQGYRLWERELKTSTGQVIPLGSLNGEELGLTYEGTFARPKHDPNTDLAGAFFSDKVASDVRSKSWMRKFLLDSPACDYMTDTQFWLVGVDSWIVAGQRAGGDIYEHFISFSKVLEIIQDLPTGSRSIMVIHPEYVRN